MSEEITYIERLCNGLKNAGDDIEHLNDIHSIRSNFKYIGGECDPVVPRGVYHNISLENYSIETGVTEFPQDTVCPCGKTGIKNRCYIKQNGKPDDQLIMIGRRCINHFMMDKSIMCPSCNREHRNISNNLAERGNSIIGLCRACTKELGNEYDLDGIAPASEDETSSEDIDPEADTDDDALEECFVAETESESESGSGSESESEVKTPTMSKEDQLAIRRAVEDNVQSSAIGAYEKFHNVLDVTLAQVRESSLGIDGWAMVSKNKVVQKKKKKTKKRSRGESSSAYRYSVSIGDRFNVTISGLDVNGAPFSGSYDGTVISEDTWGEDTGQDLDPLTQYINFLFDVDGTTMYLDKMTFNTDEVRRLDSDNNPRPRTRRRIAL